MAGIVNRLTLALGVLGMAFGLAACTSGASTSTPIVVRADDGTVLRGRIYGSGTTGVVLVHDYGSDQKVWESLANTLTNRGFMVATYDMRGHGDSPGSRDIGLSAGDTAAVVRYLNNFAQRSQVELVGVGLGGTAVLKAAAQEQVLAVAALSPYSEFRGLSAAQDVTRVTGAKLFVVGTGDPDALAASQSLQASAKPPADLTQVPGKLRGDALKSGLPQDAREAVVNFLAKNKKA